MFEVHTQVTSPTAFLKAIRLVLSTTSTDLSPRSVVTVAVVPIATPSHLIVPAAASHVMDCP